MRYKVSTYEVRVQRLQECPGSMKVDSPEAALTYWREKIDVAPWYDPEREACAAILLNTRYVATSHTMVSVGTLNESVVHPREVFRAAVAMGAYGLILMHNHPSGDPSPSADAGRILQINLLDHVIVGTPEPFRPGHFSFREAGIL